MHATVSAKLSQIALHDPEGQQIRLGSLWATQPCVVAFLRHYG